jgi:prevent-host-death family protein
MKTVNMHEAKSQLSRLVEQALAGEEIIIAKAGRPMVRLLPVRLDKQPRIPGRLKGQIRLSADFDTTPAEVIDGFEDGEE